MTRVRTPIALRDEYIPGRAVQWNFSGLPVKSPHVAHDFDQNYYFINTVFFPLALQIDNKLQEQEDFVSRTEPLGEERRGGFLQVGKSLVSVMDKIQPSAWSFSWNINSHLYKYNYNTRFVSPRDLGIFTRHGYLSITQDTYTYKCLTLCINALK